MEHTGSDSKMPRGKVLSHNPLEIQGMGELTAAVGAGYLDLGLFGLVDGVVHILQEFHIADEQPLDDFGG